MYKAFNPLSLAYQNRVAPVTAPSTSTPPVFNMTKAMIMTVVFSVYWLICQIVYIYGFYSFLFTSANSDLIPFLIPTQIFLALLRLTIWALFFRNAAWASYLKSSRVHTAALSQGTIRFVVIFIGILDAIAMGAVAIGNSSELEIVVGKVAGMIGVNLVFAGVIHLHVKKILRPLKEAIQWYEDDAIASKKVEKF